MDDAARGFATKRLLVTVPCDGWVRAEVSACLIAIACDPRIRGEVRIVHDRPYESAMNRAVRMVMQDGFDHWLSIDADNPPAEHIVDHIPFGYPLVGFPTPIYRHGEILWNVWRDGRPVRQRGDKAELVQAVGSGCLYLTRRAIEAIGVPLFVRGYDADGVADDGPDIGLCRRANAVGIRPLAQWSCVCEHWNETGIGQWQNTDRSSCADLEVAAAALSPSN